MRFYEIASFRIGSKGNDPHLKCCDSLADAIDAVRATPKDGLEAIVLRQYYRNRFGRELYRVLHRFGWRKP